MPRRRKIKGTVTVNVPGDSAKLLQIDAYAKSLTKENGRKVKTELRRSLRLAAKPTTDKQKAAVKALPRVGSKLKMQAARKTKIQPDFGKRTAGVRFHVPGKKGGDRIPQQLNRGGLRHPLYGNRHFWYTTAVPKGWFDAPAHQSADAMRKAVSKAIDQTMKGFGI